MKNKYLILILFLALLQSCQSAQNALQGNTRSERSDEFLVEKKNPLSMPPDINDLPQPIDNVNEKNKFEDDQNLKAKLKIKSSSNNKNSIKSNESTLEKKIIEKIND